MTTCDEALAALDRLERIPGARLEGSWNVHQVLVHCAQSVEYSMTGYPMHRSRVFQATLGKLALGIFLRRGRMSHDRVAPIPGAPELPSSGTTKDGCDRLRAALEAFRAFTGRLAPHFAYGAVTREQYERLHAMHLANHLAALLPEAVA